MSLFSNLVDVTKQQLFELTYGGFQNKQKSITKLFPTFNDRVKVVNANGGIDLVTQLPEVWKFKVASGTKPGNNYTVFLRFKNIPNLLAQFVPNKKLWKKDLSGINYNLLAPEVFNKADMEMDCSCPADLYWGPEYIKTQRQAQFGSAENRPPKIRNPKQYGIVCKHGFDVLDRLPFYTSTFASFLKSFYGKEIQEMFDEINSKEVEAGA